MRKLEIEHGSGSAAMGFKGIKIRALEIAEYYRYLGLLSLVYAHYLRLSGERVLFSHPLSRRSLEPCRHSPPGLLGPIDRRRNPLRALPR
jgi:hypothetical protein